MFWSWIWPWVSETKEKTVAQLETSHQKQKKCFSCTFKDSFLLFLKQVLYFYFPLSSANFIAGFVCICSWERLKCILNGSENRNQKKKAGEEESWEKPSAWCTIFDFYQIATISSAKSFAESPA